MKKLLLLAIITFSLNFISFSAEKSRVSEKAYEPFVNFVNSEIKKNSLLTFGMGDTFIDGRNVHQIICTAKAMVDKNNLDPSKAMSILKDLLHAGLDRLLMRESVATKRYLKDSLNEHLGRSRDFRTINCSTVSKPVVQPAKPVVQPAKPVAQPAKPVAQPAKPVAQPAKSVAQPAMPGKTVAYERGYESFANFVSSQIKGKTLLSYGMGGQVFIDNDQVNPIICKAKAMVKREKLDPRKASSIFKNLLKPKFQGLESELNFLIGDDFEPMRSVDCSKFR